jgi:hypothetical protein
MKVTIMKQDSQFSLRLKETHTVKNLNSAELLEHYSELSEEARTKVSAFIRVLSRNPELAANNPDDELESIGGIDLDLIEIAAEAERAKAVVLATVNEEISRMADAIDKFLRWQNDEIQAVRQSFEPRKQHRKYLKLHKYFKRQAAGTVTLTFGEIEEIIGTPLPKSVQKTIYWTRKGSHFIGDCWVSNGYRIQELDINSRRVTFYRFLKLGADYPAEHQNGR